MNLFNYDKVPLAHKYRADSLDNFYGQEHIKKLLFKMLDKKKMISSIFYGPSGTGKTTLARIIANILGYDYEYLNATKSSKTELLDILEKSKNSTNKILLFLDELHRFNKLQQDTLLEDLENGNILLIGATTENPYYSINKAIISRVLVFEFKKLNSKNIYNILIDIVNKDNFDFNNEILEYISEFANGDARVAINMLETLNNVELLNSNIEDISILFKSNVFADKYDVISAMIKSIRGSDPDAAVYWMSRLLVGGEDPMYVARRLVILASEDIGLANSNALTLAVSTLNSVKEIGMPEARIMLSHCAIYLALSPKSNSAYNAVNKAFDILENEGYQEVPFYLTKAGSKNYKYPHDYENSYVKQKYMNNKIKLYEPGENKFEKSMEKIWKEIKKGDN